MPVNPGFNIIFTISYFITCGNFHNLLNILHNLVIVF